MDYLNSYNSEIKKYKLPLFFFFFFFFFFITLKEYWLRGKKIQYKKKSRLSPDPVKKIVGEIKNGGIFNLV